MKRWLPILILTGLLIGVVLASVASPQEGAPDKEFIRYLQVIHCLSENEAIAVDYFLETRFVMFFPKGTWSTVNETPEYIEKVVVTIEGWRWTIRWENIEGEAGCVISFISVPPDGEERVIVPEKKRVKGEST